jgi:hypothetical protein
MFSHPFPMGSEAVPPEARILTPIAEPGQYEPLEEAVESFVQRVCGLTDEDRRIVAERRRGLNEVFREKALRAGAEAIPAQAELYVQARMRVAHAHLPVCLDEGAPDEEWSEISRLVQLAIDEGLLAFVGSRTLHPNHLRELIAPWPVG